MIAPNSTGARVVAHLQKNGIKEKGTNEHGEHKYRCTDGSPLRPGSDSDGFTLVISPDGEHGAFHDKINGEKGSLYDLAAKVGVPLPKRDTEDTKRAYTSLADYAESHYVPASVFVAAGWKEVTYQGRPAFQFQTNTGTKYRFVDGEKPTFKPEKTEYKPCFYRLPQAIKIRNETDQPLVICNGEPSSIAAQYYNVAATATTSGENKEIAASIIAALAEHYPAPNTIIVAPDCDTTGREGAKKWDKALREAGYAVRVVDLQGGDKFDLADFCGLHKENAAQALQALPDLVFDAPATVASNDATSPTKNDVPLSQQIRTALHALGYTFRYNAVTLTMEVNGAPISDAAEAVIRMHMRDLGYKNMSAIEDVYTSVAHEHTYNPIRNYLESLTWDGHPHIARFADHVTCVDDPVVYTDGQERGLFYVYLYRWMMGAVAKVYANEQNMMLVLEGPQGVGKSTIAEWLASPLSNYFVSQSIQTDDKDSALRLARNFIWEVDELGATIRRSDVEALKSFITHKHIVVRPAYARRDIHVPAMASMIGTINKGAGFLSDPTGSRRFYVTGINAIDWSYTKIDVNQMWAQAVHDYKDGVAQGRKPWKLQASEDVRRKDANQEREVRTLLDDWINMDLYLDGAQDTGMTAADIIDHFRERGHILSGTTRAQAMELADALLKRGITHKQATINGVRGRYYLGVTKNVH